MGDRLEWSAKCNYQESTTIIDTRRKDYVDPWLLKKELVIALVGAFCGCEPFMRLHWAGWDFTTFWANG